MALTANLLTQAVPAGDVDADELIARYVRPHPIGHGRAYAVIADGPSVSAIIRHVMVEDTDVAKTAKSWHMPEDAVRAALAFYQRHEPYFEARILLEDDDFDFGRR